MKPLLLQSLQGLRVYLLCGNGSILLSALIGLFSLFLYGFIYTPLKKVNSVAVLVGAFPGALPCLIGWVAATNEFSTGGWILFGIQFLWQFPHFWAIAWVAHKDYSNAGLNYCQVIRGPTKFTALANSYVFNADDTGWDVALLFSYKWDHFNVDHYWFVIFGWYLLV